MPLSALLEQLVSEAHAWIVSERNAHWPVARPLSQAEIDGLTGYFGQAALGSARVRTGLAIANPPFHAQAVSALARLGIRTEFRLADASGITLVDCILVRERDPSPDLIFHEMVHVVQYRLLSSRGFARRYVLGLAEATFVYERNPLEAVAFALQERFLAGERFDAEEIVQRALD